MNATIAKYAGLGMALFGLVKQQGNFHQALGAMLKAAAPHAVDAVLSGKAAQLEGQGKLEIDWFKVALTFGAVWLIWRQTDGNVTTISGDMKATKLTVHTIDERVAVIQSVIKQGREDPEIRRLTGEVLQGVRSKDWLGEVEAVFHYVRENVRYTRDIAGVDTFQKAIRTLEMQIGDCDDMSIIICSMLGSVGYPLRLKVSSTGGKDFDHIYPLVGLPPHQPVEWIVLDASIDAPIGSEVSDHFSRTYEVR